jgi:8-oxo-dGTP pyrophosphatase MutT (NUDIX family)
MSDAIRPAATVILTRPGPRGAEVLMGQRGAGAVFMPSKFVFPGGGIDPVDHAEPRPGYLAADCMRRLALYAPEEAPSPDVVVAAALRELAEETGLAAPAPTTGALRFVFRAITPPGRTRRFDARFLLADAAGLPGDPDDLSAASGELAHLRWLPLPEARALDLPFITEVVLAEIAALFAGHDQPGVPFFDNSGDTPRFRRIV